MMRLSGFRLIDKYDETTDLDVFLKEHPDSVIEIYVHSPAAAGLYLIPAVLYTLRKKDRIIYSFDFSKRVYKWKNEEIYLTRHEEVALYAHMHCEADIYWGVALRTIRGRLGKNFMADEKELELGCKICDR